MTKRKSGAAKAAASTPQPKEPRPTMMERIGKALGEHQDEILSMLASLSQRLPPAREARRVHLVLAERGASYASHMSRPETTVHAPGLTLHADEQGVIKLTADDCRRLARLLGALPEPPAPAPSPLTDGDVHV